MLAARRKTFEVSAHGQLGNELANWTPTLRDEFQKRRGYDLLPWLPVLAGKLSNSRDASDCFFLITARRSAT